MNWWCAAQGRPWDWTWQPYPGVWLFVTLVFAGWIVANARWGADPITKDAPRLGRRQVTLFVSGVITLWVAADWPLGALGAGYLVSAHTVQYLLFALIAPPLLIAGTPRRALHRALSPRWVWATARVLTRPLPAFVVFNVVMLGTHLPTVVDTLGATQLGSFVRDMAWLVSGIVFWWPVLAPVPELGSLSYPARILYLVLNVFIPTVPASFLTFADYPIYALYELAPRVGSISATTDQQIAGLTMKIVGGMIIFITASVLFFKWHHREGDADSSSLAIPATAPRL